jgi:glycosyltransferase involved in cell wall biosynthesis
MRLLITLTYYAPHVSGLTVHARRLAEGLAARGHEVTVLTSRHDRRLPRRETIAGVDVVRVPVAMSLSKGAVMPTYLAEALPHLRRAEIVSINLPTSPSEALLLPLVARVGPRRALVATYHCDLQLAPGVWNVMVSRAVQTCNVAASALARRIVAYTSDYARNSRVLRRCPHKVEVIPPPVDMPVPDPDIVSAFRRRHAPSGEILLGVASRLASEKGLDHLLRAIPGLRTELGPVRVLFAGETTGVIGEERYRRLFQPMLASVGDSWVPLGVLEQPQLATFFGACDVTVLPSVNMTESFGLVQVESMLCGTPVVTTDLPGVRVPVRTTGMGLVVPPRDPGALVAAISQIARNRARFVRPRDEVMRSYSLADSIARYEALFHRLQ